MEEMDLKIRNKMTGEWAWLICHQIYEHLAPNGKCGFERSKYGPKRWK